MSAAASGQLISFGPFEFDPRLGLLYRGEEEIYIPPRAAGVLQCLLEQPGEVVAKQSLLDAVWADSYVSDTSLSEAVGVLRQALGDDPQNPTYIQTVHRRGYRFIAGVSTTQSTEGRPNAAAAAVTPMWNTRRAAPWLVGTACVAAALAVLILLDVGELRSWLLGETRPRFSSLVVLPFDNLSGDTSQQHHVDGVTEALITELTKVGGLSVTSWTSAKHYRDPQKLLPQIAEELSVEAVVEGSVYLEDDRVRVNVQLVDAATDHYIWADNFVRDYRDILALCSEVARAIAAEIQVGLTADEMGRLAGSAPVNPEAHDAYLRGNSFANRTSPEGWFQAVAYFEQAIQADPQYAPAYAALARTSALLPTYRATDYREMYFSKARDAARAAISLDPTLPDAHAAMGLVELFYDWDWDAAESELQSAVRLAPGSADALIWHGGFLVCMTRDEEAIAAGRRALALDPFWPPTQYWAGLIFYHTRRYDEAISHLGNAIEMDPSLGWPYPYLLFTYVSVGRFEDALAPLQAARDLEGFERVHDFMKAYLEASRGNEDEALRYLVRPPDTGPRPWARTIILAALGMKDEAFDSLDQAFQARAPELVIIRNDPRFDPLRDDPRFGEFLRRMRFPE
jgi:TolB-like protein/DNA-binding winged helix-turn-helix (wHTH) protein/Tfp pilus assembly protein PilF